MKSISTCRRGPQVERDRQPDAPDARGFAGVGGLRRMFGPLDGRDEVESAVLLGQGDQPLAHPAAAPVIARETLRHLDVLSRKFRLKWTAKRET